MRSSAEVVDLYMGMRGSLCSALKSGGSAGGTLARVDLKGHRSSGRTMLSRAMSFATWSGVGVGIGIEMGTGTGIRIGIGVRLRDRGDGGGGRLGSG